MSNYPLEKDEIAGKLPSEVDVINVREVQEVCESDEFENLLKYMILKKMNLHCFYIPRVPLPLPRV